MSSKLSISNITVKVFFFGIYMLLLPIGTGLAGILGNTSLLNYFAGIIILSGLINLKKIKLKTKFTLLYFIYTVVSLLWSPSYRLNWYVMTNAVNFLLFLVLTSHQWKDKEIKFINKCIELSQIIVVLVVVKNISTLFSYRLSITIVSSIGISDYAFGLCLLIAYWLNTISASKSKLKKIIAIVSLAFDLAVIVMAGSRGAFVMIFAMFLLLFLMQDYSMKTKIGILIFGIIAYVLFTQYFIHMLPSTVVNRMTLEAVKSSNGSGRFNIWKLAWDIFTSSNINRLLLGYGFNSFSNTISYGSHGGHMDLMAHNVVVQTMIEGGIIGISALTTMFISQIRVAWKTQNSTMRFAVIGLMIASLSIDMQVTRIWGAILTLNYVFYFYEKTKMNCEVKK